jgi:hypothetical protein
MSTTVPGSRARSSAHCSYGQSTSARRGVIAQTVSSFGLHTDYHRVSDEASTIDYIHMTDAIRSMLKPILWLANASLKPEWKSGMKPE